MNEYMWGGEEPRKFYMCVEGYKDYCVCVCVCMGEGTRN